MQSQEHYQALLDPGCYPDKPRRVFVRDTHISRLFFTSSYVYKLKKKVDFGFLDFTTLDRRRFFCEEELRLNRRFAKNTYLDVLPVRKVSGLYRVGAHQGEIVDYVVRMRRLPQAKMLDRKIRRNDPALKEMMGQLAGTLMKLLERGAPVLDISPDQMFHSIRHNWEENLSQTRTFVGDLLDERTQEVVQRYGTMALSEKGHKRKFIERASNGYVLEGHGDLHTEHICLTDPIRIYDCIEFNRRFRINDLLSELAFLIMDLDHRGRHDLAESLYTHCRTFKPAIDDPELLTFYKVYRAWVRGKVAALTSNDAHILEHERDRQRRSSQQYFAQSLGYLNKPSLVLMCGLMGSGKSFLAQALERASTWPVIRSDFIRKELAGIAPETHIDDAYNSGLYKPETSRKTYQTMLDRSEKLLNGGPGVIVDASFIRSSDRQAFQKLATRHKVPCLTVWTSCPYSVSLRRLDKRTSDGTDASDGRRELFAQQNDSYEVPKDYEITEKIDSTKDVDYNVQLVLSRLISDHGWQ